MTDSWWLGGVSVPGTRHVKEGRPCDDAHFVGESDESFVLVACDGAGSKRFSRHGAAAVAPAVGRLLLANAEEVMARRVKLELIIEVARSAIEPALAIHGGVMEDYATTLVGLLVHDGKAMTCHVGDGAIFCLEGEFPRCISPPETHPSGGPFTAFVTSRGVKPRMWSFPVAEHWTGFLCVTDGAQPGLMNTVTGACSPVSSRVLSRFDVADTRSDRERLLQRAVEDELQARSEDDITVVGARRAFVAGLYGCPQCRRRAVHRQVTADGRFLAKCGVCRHIVFLYEQNVEDAIRQHQSVARAAGVRIIRPANPPVE